MTYAHHRYVLVLVVLFALEWALLAIAPVDREAWALENLLVVIAVILLALTYKSFPFSRLSYTAIFIFLSIHTIGAHYTYAKVPYDQWLQDWLNFSLNTEFDFERNHFDRLVHFLYGLLIAYPIRELFIRIAGVKGFWGYFLPLDLTMSSSMVFELFEWLAAELFGGDLAMDFLGIQGDIWDAHKDMALASLGAFIAMVFTALLNRTLQRDFAEEWNESLRIKKEIPLGDELIKRYLSR